MDNNIDNDPSLSYKCQLCNKTFLNRGTYWSHLNKKKTACITQERCKEIVDEMQTKETQLHYFESKTEKQKRVLEQKETEIQKLKEIVSKLSEKDLYVKESMNTMLERIDDVKESIEDSKQQFVTTNNNNMINNQVLNIDSTDKDKMLFGLDFTKNSKEKLDHISMDMLLAILNHIEFNDTLKHLAKAVFFHPKAPENWKWCVTDKNAKFGALEYNHESHTVVRRLTGSVINSNMQNLVFQITDLLAELKMKRTFNHTQIYNYNKIFNLMGNEFTPEQISSIKESAFDGRNLAKALWESLHIVVESTPVVCQVRTKQIKSSNSDENIISEEKTIEYFDSLIGDDPNTDLIVD